MGTKIRYTQPFLGLDRDQNGKIRTILVKMGSTFSFKIRACLHEILMPKTRLSECPKTLDSSSTLNVKVMSHEMIYELHKTIPQSQITFTHSNLEVFSQSE